MFTELTGFFDRNFVIGHLLPTILFSLITGVVFSALFDVQLIGLQWTTLTGTHIAYPIVQDIDSATLLLGMIALACLTLAVLLSVLNRPFTRLLEGYYPPVSWFRKWGERGYRRLMDELKGTTDAYLREQGQGQVTPKTQQRYRELLIKRATRYPDRQNLVLPTAFGNAIRAFEVYSRIMYGADVIPIWPRLLAVIDESFRATLANAKAAVDFTVNIFYLAWLFLIELVVFALASGHAAKIASQYWWFVPIAVLVIVVSYSLAVVRAIQWGTFVKAAVDLYLPTLLERLGYKQVGDEAARNVVWQGLSRSFIYLEPLPEKPDSSAANTSHRLRPRPRRRRMPHV